MERRNPSPSPWVGLNTTLPGISRGGKGEAGFREGPFSATRE